MLVEILLVFVCLFVFLYRYVTKHFGRWEKEGLPTIPPSFPCGSHMELLYMNRHLNECIMDDYNAHRNDPMHGWYMFGKPTLSINSVEHIKNVMVKDFDHFVDRNSDNLDKVTREGGKIDQIWARQLTNLRGDEWKDVRSTFSPIFTSGKMKGMVSMIENVSGLLVKEIDTYAESGEDFELKSVFGKFSLDSLASCAFGMDAESFTNENSKFVSYAARIFTNTPLDMFLVSIKFIPIVRYVMKILGINIFKPKQTKFFESVILKVIKHRRQTGERQNDLIDLMLDAMKSPDQTVATGEDTTESDKNWSQYENDMKLKHTSKIDKIDEDLLVATAIILLVAGYDTTGMTLSFMAHHLGKNPDVQAKLQQEIDEAFEAADGALPDYTTLQNLPYLEQVILETLRIQTPVGVLLRMCTKDYTFPGTNITLKRDDLVSIPIIGIHMDERYFPNPEKFNPDNFTKEAKSKRSPYSFLPFGQGPRACIGMRFAMLEAKIAMALAVRKFHFENSPKNPEKLQLDPTSQLGYIKGGLYGRVKRRQDVN